MKFIYYEVKIPNQNLNNSSNNLADMENTELFPTIDSSDENVVPEMTTKHDRTQALSHEGQSESIYDSVKFDDVRAKFESNEVTAATSSEIGITPQPVQTITSIDKRENNASFNLPTVDLQDDQPAVQMSVESGVVEEPTTSVRQTISRIEAMSSPDSSKSDNYVLTKSIEITPTESNKTKRGIHLCEQEDFPSKEAIVNVEINRTSSLSVNSTVGETLTEVKEENTETPAAEKAEEIKITEVQVEPEADFIEHLELQSRESEVKGEPELNSEAEPETNLEAGVLMDDQPVANIIEPISTKEPTTYQSIAKIVDHSTESMTPEVTQENTSVLSQLLPKTDQVKGGSEN